MATSSTMTRQKRRGKRGQSLVEFALSTSIFILLFSGVIDLGRAFFTLIALESVISEGAHWAAAYPDCIPTASDSLAGSPACQGTNSIVGRMLNETTNLDRNSFTEVTVTSDDVTRWVYNWNNGVPPKGETVLFRVSYRVPTIMPVTRLLFGTNLSVTAQAREVVRGKGMPDFNGAPTTQGSVEKVAKPATPTGVTQTNSGPGNMKCNDGKATISWNPQIATGYRIFDANSAALIAEVRPASNTTTEITVGIGASRNILVKAFNQNNLHEEEGASTAITVSCNNVQPTNLIFNCISGGFQASWTAAATDLAVAQYKLYRMHLGIPTHVATFSGALTTTGMYFYSSTEDTNTDYYLMAARSDGSTIGVQSNSIHTDCTIAPNPPDAAANFRWALPNTCSAGQTTLAWDVATGATGYYLYDETSGTPALLTTIANGFTTTYTVNVGSGATKLYSIQPYVWSLSGNIPGPKSSILTISCPPLTAPALNAPTCGGLGPSGYTYADFTWNAYSGDTSPVGYKLYRQGSPSVVKSGTISPLGTTTVRLTFSSGDNPATYFLQLVNSSGNPIGTAGATRALNCPAPAPVVIVSQPSCQSVSGSTRRYTWIVQNYTWGNPYTFLFRNANGNGPWAAESYTVNSPVSGQTSIRVVMSKNNENDNMTISVQDTGSGQQLVGSTSATFKLPTYNSTTCP